MAVTDELAHRTQRLDNNLDRVRYTNPYRQLPKL